MMKNMQIDTLKNRILIRIMIKVAACLFMIIKHTVITYLSVRNIIHGAVCDVLVYTINQGDELKLAEADEIRRVCDAETKETSSY